MPSGEPFGVQNPLTSNLDVGSFGIVSSGDADITITPDGSGAVVLGGVAPKGTEVLAVAVRSGTASPVIIQESNDSNGMSLNVAGSGYSGFGLGVYWDGSNWKSLSVGAALIYKTPNEIVTYTDAGLTPGNTYTPTIVSRAKLVDGAYGFGPDTPTKHLEVMRTTASGIFAVNGLPTIRVTNKQVVTHSFAAMEVAGDNGTVLLRTLVDGLGSGALVGEAGSILYTVTNHPLFFGTNGAYRGGFKSDGTFVIASDKMLVDINGGVLFGGDSSGYARAEIYAYNVADEITIAGFGIANKVQITSFNANGLSLNATPDHTADHITITKAGIYYCHVEITADSVAGSAARFGFGVFKNDGATLFQNCHKHRDLVGGAGGNAGSVSLGGLIDLAVDDTIEVWVYNEDNTQNISIDDIVLTLIQVGGT